MIDMIGNWLIGHWHMIKYFSFLALEALEAKSSQYILERQKTEEAIEWYNRILGFRAECGEGKYEIC